MTTAVAVRNQAQMGIEAIKQYAAVFKESGMFPDIKSAAQAVVKIQAGAELGLPPFQAMKSVHIIQGNCTLAGNTIAGMVKSHPRYDYVLEESTDKVCRGKFIDRTTATEHPHEYTWADAERAGDSKKDNYRKHPAAMLFNRFISSGQKKYAPDATNGVLVYTPDELGGQIDHEGAYVETTAEVIEPNCGPAQQAKHDAMIAKAFSKGICADELTEHWAFECSQRQLETTAPAALTPEQFDTVFQATCGWVKSELTERADHAAAAAAHEAAEQEALAL